jgi:hypothetical protein
VVVHVSASDPSGVSKIACSFNDADAPGPIPVSVAQSGTNPRTGSFTAGNEGRNWYSCEATDGATPPNTGAASGSHNETIFRIDDNVPRAFTPQSPVFQRRRDVLVKWSASDPLAGTQYGSSFGSFDVRYRDAAFDSNVFDEFTESDRAAARTEADRSFGIGTFRGKEGDTLCFSTQAIDGARNFSGYTPEKCTAIPLDDVAFTQFGGWTRIHHSGYYSGTLTKSSTIGSKLLSPVVSGTQLALLVTTGSSGGKIRTRWHGQTKTISLHSIHTKNRKVVVLHGYTGRGQLLIRVVGRGVSAIDGLGVWKRP